MTAPLMQPLDYGPIGGHVSGVPLYLTTFQTHAQKSFMLLSNVSTFACTPLILLRFSPDFSVLFPLTVLISANAL